LRRAQPPWTETDRSEDTRREQAHSRKSMKKNDYSDIIHLPHHVSSTHTPMPLRDRAAQFAPFAALTGHSAAIDETARLTTEMTELSEDAKALLDMKQQILMEAAHLRPVVTLTYFRQDELKHGGAYLTLTGHIKKVDQSERVIIMESGERIELDSVAGLESELFGTEL